MFKVLYKVSLSPLKLVVQYEVLFLNCMYCNFHFAAACMTWELAESGKHFITTIINGSDLVPTFSTASLDDLRSEVRASSWLNDMRDQIEHTRVLNVVYRSATALGSRLPSVASTKARVAGAGALLKPVSSSTQVVMKRAQNVAQAVVRTRSSLSSWSCMGARRRHVGSIMDSEVEDLPEAAMVSERNSDAAATEGMTSDPLQNEVQSSSSSNESGHDDTDEEELLLPIDRVTSASTVEDVTEGELWYELEKELQRQENESDVRAQEEEAAAAKEITEEEICWLMQWKVISQSQRRMYQRVSAFVPLAESCISFPPLHLLLLIWSMVCTVRNTLVYTRHRENCIVSYDFQKR
ncbi:hypothetical protein I3843_01G135900 [Carya illinoinensis]|nr:hypothetical protein I3843_01G135900 [Carya illinoinensis]